MKPLAAGLAIVALTTLVSTGAAHPGETSSFVLPERVAGYRVVKADLHMHTVFSDGHVWPDFRAMEAQQDGLDALSITEHLWRLMPGKTRMEVEAGIEGIDLDDNRSYEIARSYLDSIDSDVLLIPGIEISPRVPPFHHNAIFLEDINRISRGHHTEKTDFASPAYRKTLLQTFRDAREQGAFIFFNHPGYRWWDFERYGDDLFTEIHRMLYDEGLIDGVEVMNGGTYRPKAHAIALQRGLTMLSNSDEHWSIARRFDMRGRVRPMNLVLVEEWSAAGMKAALQQRRSIAFGDGLFAGPPELLEALFFASLEISVDWMPRRHVKYSERVIEVRLVNRSSIDFQVSVQSPYALHRQSKSAVTIAAHDTTLVRYETVRETPGQLELRFTVRNLLAGPDRPHTVARMVKVPAPSD